MVDVEWLNNGLPEQYKCGKCGKIFTFDVYYFPYKEAQNCCTRTEVK